MTERESKKLKAGDRVMWDGDETDLGSVTECDYLCVRIKWDNGQEGTVHHADMKKISKVKP